MSFVELLRSGSVVVRVDKKSIASALMSQESATPGEEERVTIRKSERSRGRACSLGAKLAVRSGRRDRRNVTSVT